MEVRRAREETAQGDWVERAHRRGRSNLLSGGSRLARLQLGLLGSRHLACAEVANELGTGSLGLFVFAPLLLEFPFHPVEKVACFDKVSVDSLRLFARRLHKGDAMKASQRILKF